MFAYGLNAVRVARPLRLLVTVTAFALVLVVWTYTTPQPRIQLGEVRLRTLPTSASPGVVELVVRNGGSISASVTASQVGHLAGLFKNPGDQSAGGVEDELSALLERMARERPDDRLVIAPGQSVRLEVDVPASQRAWFIGRGEATVFVAARFRYRDRAFVRDRAFCLFVTPPSGKWAPCPFLND